jgi:Family of unknown function (DUF5677)
VSNIVMPPTTKILKIAETLDQAVGQFMSAAQTIPPRGKFESDAEALLLFILVIRDIEAILALARTDLVLLPSANVLARAVFEIALKAAWMVQPDDPFDREVRWLAHLAEEERLHKAISESVTKSGGDPVVFKERHAQIKEFRAGVAKILPSGYSELKGNPGVERMLENLDQKHMYSLYRLLAQYVHGGHASTGLYRKGLGTLKQGGEFISPGEWYLPLWSAWKNLQIFGEYLLEHLKAERPTFLTPEDIRSVDLTLSQLGSCDSHVN